MHIHSVVFPCTSLFVKNPYDITLIVVWHHCADPNLTGNVTERVFKDLKAHCSWQLDTLRNDFKSEASGFVDCTFHETLRTSYKVRSMHGSLPK